MTFGFNLYLCCLILTLSGLFNGPLKKAGLSTGLACSFFGLAAVFSLMEDIQLLPSLYINAGGFIIPMALCLWILAKSGGRDRLLMLVFGALSAACAYLLSQFLSDWIESVFTSLIWPRTILVLLFSVLLCSDSREALVCSYFGLYISTVIEYLDPASGVSVTALGSGVELNAAAAVLPIVLIAFELIRIGKKHYRPMKAHAGLDLGGR